MRLKLEIHIAFLIVCCVLACNYLPIEIAIASAVGILLYLIWIVRKDRQTYVNSQRKNIEFETIEQVVQRLPTSLSIGAHTHQEVFQRVIQLWEDSENKGIILENILEGVCLLSPEGDVQYYNKRLLEIFGEVGPSVHGGE